jgi:hypothetical protein
MKFIYFVLELLLLLLSFKIAILNKKISFEIYGYLLLFVSFEIVNITFGL